MIVIMQALATERLVAGGNLDPIGFRLLLSLYSAESKGTLTLQSTDPSVQPLLNYNYLDKYSERELELLSKIEASVSKENKKNKILELTWDDFLNDNELLNIEIILNFTHIKIDKKNELTPPNLALLIKKPEEKKLLWEKMQALLNDD